MASELLLELVVCVTLTLIRVGGRGGTCHAKISCTGRKYRPVLFLVAKSVLALSKVYRAVRKSR